MEVLTKCIEEMLIKHSPVEFAKYIVANSPLLLVHSDSIEVEQIQGYIKKIGLEEVHRSDDFIQLRPSIYNFNAKEAINLRHELLYEWFEDDINKEIAKIGQELSGGK